MSAAIKPHRAHFMGVEVKNGVQKESSRFETCAINH